MDLGSGTRDWTMGRGTAPGRSLDQNRGPWPGAGGLGQEQGDLAKSRGTWPGAGELG